MATTKSISRSNGQSAVASASYRSGEKLQDERYDKIQDYSKRHGVISADIILPSHLKDQSQISRNSLWNMAEQAEKRKDSRVAREWIVNLPHELDEKTRKETAHAFAQSLADRYGVIADCCIHRPTEKEIERGADPRNFHAHIMLTTRKAELNADNKISLGDKASIELSDTKRRSLGLDRVSVEIVEIRELWERTANEKLAEHGHDLIDSRSYQSQGIDIVPQLKMGKNATQMERDGIQTPVGDINREIKERNELVFANELAHIERTNKFADDIIFEIRKPKQTEIITEPPQEQPKPQEQAKPSFAERMAEIRARNAQKTPTDHQAERKARDEKVEKAWQEFKQQQEKAEQISTQQAKMGELSKGEVTPATYEKLQTYPPEPLQQLKAEHEERAEKLADKAQHEPLTDSELKDYAFSRKLLPSIDRLEQERATAEAERLRLEQERQAQEKNNKKQSQLTVVSEPKPQTVIKPSNERLKPQEKQSARVVPTKPEKSLEGDNRPHNEPSKSDILEKQNIIKEYAEKVQATAKAIWDSHLKALREKAKPIFEKIQKLRADEPLFLGKKQWEQDLKTNENKHNAIKQTHDSMKDKGVTEQHYQQAREHIAKHEPSYHVQVQQAIKDLESHKQAENAKFARENGVDRLATNGEYYSGKILKVTEKGAYQQTSKGVVLHPAYANDKTLKLDKSYDLDYRLAEKTGQVLTSETYEVRLPSKDPSHVRDTSPKL